MRRPLLLRRAAVAICTATALVVAGLGTPATAAAKAEVLGVDLQHTTGAFRGGATGTLYGFGDDGVPTQTLIDGAHVTNTSQKPPGGAQHPSGDALDIESFFFAGAGRDLYVYIQDDYSDWPYNKGKRPGNDASGAWSYLAVVRKVVEKVASGSAHPDRIVFIPFNEPDGGNWYPEWPEQRARFLADWSATYRVIQAVYREHGLGHARVGGPGDSRWHADRSRDFLRYTKAHHQLPDVFIWHELATDSTATFPGHLAAYRRLGTATGVPRIPVNITEYGLPRDMGVPGRLVQYLSLFERAKVDAQTAFWNYAGNLDDNSSRVNGANGGWWLFDWYGDLAGATTARVTPPKKDSADGLQGLAAVDRANRRATVLFGGGSRDVRVRLRGIDRAVFGSAVDVTVRAVGLNGGEGASPQPPVVLSTRAAVHRGTVTIRVPNTDRRTAYRLQLTAASAGRAAVSHDLVSSVEAEDARITAAKVVRQDPSRGFEFQASGGKDVGSFKQARSRADWTVRVPRSGEYRLSVLAGTNAKPGSHALFVDGRFATTAHYAATLKWSYRGTAEALVRLPAGRHTLSLRASRNGRTVLPGADITLDRFDLFDVTRGEHGRYPSTEARLSGGAALRYPAGAAALTGGAAATWFVAPAETGYTDLTVHWTTSGPSSLTAAVNRRTAATLTAPRAGTWASTVRVWLAQGVDEVTLTAPSGAQVSSITTARTAATKSADRSASVARPALASLRLTGRTTVRTVPSSTGTNGRAGTDGRVRELAFLGHGTGNTATIPRPAGFGAGAYVLTLGYANAQLDAAINYNPQVVSRFMTVGEAGGSTVRAAFRHNYSWQSFWDASVPLDLTTSGGAITLGNPTGWAPDVNTVTLARLVATPPVTVPAS